MAFINRSKSFSMVFLAIAALLLLTGGAQGRGLHGARGGRRGGGGGDMCRRADYPRLCREVVKGQKNSFAATHATVNRLITETVAAKKTAARAVRKHKQVLGVCLENYGDALSSLNESLADMRSHDKAGFNSNLSAALTGYETCEDAFSEMGIRSPLLKINTRLRHIADNGLFLSTLWR